MKYTRITVLALAAFCVATACVQGQDLPKSGPGRAKEKGAGRQGQQGGGASPQSFSFHTEVPTHDADIVLCRPTATGVTASVLVYAGASGQIHFGLTPEKLDQQSPVQALTAGEPASIVLDGLMPDQQYFYQFEARSESGQLLASPPVSSFHTQRAPGSAFTFAIQADSHLDGATNPAVYLETLNNEREAKADFLIDLGDTFMTDKHPDRESAHRQYLAQRYYFGQVAHATPLFLVLGNHDGESGRLAAGPDSLGVWSNGMRKKYFPNPVPDSFYTGNSAAHAEAGLLENYYAWTWGDALFVVLDPFWYTGTSNRGPTAFWDRSLGDAQYRWLVQTLSQSKAAHKFVFIHHLVGGADKNARGGAEASHFFEWGGHELDGSEAFDARRPGWSEPIHDLMLSLGVSAVFHGHDHFFMKQERDGVVYQLLPQPGHKGQGSSRSAAEYGYIAGDIETGSGYLRVSVRPESATVAFMRTPLSAGGSGASPNAEVAYEYTIPARGAK